MCHIQSKSVGNNLERNLINLRLLNQQLVSPQFKRTEELVSYMGAIQAQEYRLMRWAVEMRTCKPSASAFRKAFDEGLIVRQHLMRGTWQLVSAHDYHWMLDLFSGRARKTIEGWMRANSIEIPEDEENRIREILVDTVEKKRSVTKEDFAAALEYKGIVMDDHRLSYHIRFSELEGFLCSGNLLPMKASYALTSAKVPRNGLIDRDEALMLLARKYFQSRQPATFEDFVWWTGLPGSDCRKAIMLLGDEIHLERIGEREFYFTDNCRAGRIGKGRFLLIPPYDEYLIGYKSRDIVLPPRFAHMAHNNSGNFNPIIALDGVVCGNWKPFSKTGEATFFEGDPDAAGLQAEWLRYCSYL